MGWPSYLQSMFCACASVRAVLLCSRKVLARCVPVGSTQEGSRLGFRVNPKGAIVTLVPTHQHQVHLKVLCVPELFETAFS